jgi:phage shock protein PspC (stress-responsive transcriptional regulator)
MERRLTKSNNDRRICGVCGGIAEYLDVDTTVVRLFTAIFAVFTAVIPVLFVYLLAAMIMPSNEI